jgi:hypothetical protein
VAIIRIEDFKGLFTNGDVEQVSPEFLTTLKNFYPRNGRLVKTTEFGTKIAVSTPTFDNLVTFMSSKITSPTTGFIYLGVDVNSSTNIVTVQAPTWQNINDVSGFSFLSTYYHKDAKNPIVQSDLVLRILPGNVGIDPSGNTSNPAKGIWFGYIDRTILDGLHTISASFYDDATQLVPPNMSAFGLTITTPTGGTFAANDERFYKFTFVFDGNQETLLSLPTTKVTYAADDKGVFTFTMDENAINNRWTAMKVYRSDTRSGTYNLISTIDFLRSSEQGASDGGEVGKNKIYIPELDGVFIPENDGCRVTITGVATYTNNVITSPCSAITSDGRFTLTDDVTTDEWDKQWDFETLTGAVWSSLISNTSGSFSGDETVIIPTTFTDDSLDASTLNWDLGGTPLTRTIDTGSGNANTGRAIHYTGTTLTANDVLWSVLSQDQGSFTITKSGTTFTFIYEDTNFAEGAAHPFQDETSTNVNGEFAVIVAKRLFQAELILDPGGKNEEQPGWVSYSEVNQLDITPVSNVLFVRKGIGAITGMIELFDNPIVLKEQSIVSLLIRANPTTPSLWIEQESAHRIGNIAKQGAIKVLNNIYVCSYDGIYRLEPNNLSETDQTPTENLRISEAIGNVYAALSLAQKKAIKAEYNQARSEIYFLLGTDEYLYNVETGSWRQITSGVTPSVLFTSEEQDILLYATDKITYSSAVAQSIAPQMITKPFTLSQERQAVLRNITIGYKSAGALTMNVYADDDLSTVQATKSLPAATSLTTAKLRIGIRAKTVNIEIKETSTSTGATEINRINLETG